MTTTVKVTAGTEPGVPPPPAPEPGQLAFDRAADARVWEAKIRTMKRSSALAELDAGTETLAEFVEEWWLVYAGPNLERSTLRVYAQLWNGHALPRAAPAA